MNANGLFGVGVAEAVFRVRKISGANQLHGERDPNGGAHAGSEPKPPHKIASRSETERASPIHHGLWRHAPFVAQIIGQILPRGNEREGLARVTYGNKRTNISTIDTQA